MSSSMAIIIVAPFGEKIDINGHLFNWGSLVTVTTCTTKAW